MYSRQHGLTLDSCGFSARAAGTSTGMHSFPRPIAFLGSSDRSGTAFSLTSSLQKEVFLHHSSWRKLSLGLARKRKKRRNREEEENRWCSPCSVPRCGRKLPSPYVLLFRCFSTQGNHSPLHPSNEQKNRKLALHRLSSRVAGCWCHSRLQERGRDVLTSTHGFLLEKGFLLFKGFALIGSVLLIGMLTVYAQAKAQAHVEKRVLPPIASILGAYTGRKITFGKVQSISPLGLTLESCALGPQSEEFSCGELPMVEIRVRPLASVRRRQIVLDAVLVQPNMLVCQKQDWSWLGIPTPTEKTSHRSSTEEGLDARTKARRVARDGVVLKLAQERDKAARTSAASGYVRRVEEESYTNVKRVRNNSDWDVGGKENNSSEYSGGDSMQKSEEFDRLSAEAVKGEDEGSWRREGKVLHNDKPAFSKSLIDCRLWLDEHFMNPGPLFKNWRVKTSINKVEGQRRNLDASASAARAFFERLDHAKMGVEGSQEKSSKEMTPVKSYVSAHGSSSTTSKVVARPLKSLSTVDPIQVDRLKGELGDVTSKPEQPKEEEIDNHGYPRDVTGRKSTLTLAKDSKLDAGEEHLLTSNSNLVFLDFLHDNKHAAVDDETVDRAHEYSLEGSDGRPIITEGHGDSQLNIPQKDSKSFERDEVLGNDVERNSSGLDDGQGSLPELASLSAFKYGLRDTRSHEGAWWKPSLIEKGITKDDLKPYNDAFDDNHGIRARAIADSLVAQAKSNLKMSPLQNWLPVTLDSVYIKDGILMLLAYGDLEPRVMENVNGFVKLGNKYTQVDVHVSGKLNEWRTTTHEKTGGRLLVKVFADLRHQKWHVKLKGNNLFAPLLERLLELPLDWSDGRASGELSIWASRGDLFPNLSGRLNVSRLAFRIWEAPAGFKDVKGTLFFQGQRLFLHNTSGFFGAVPLHVSGDMDLNPESGEYRLVCQVPSVEANVLMDTLKARPPLFPVAGAIKAAVYCRGPLEVPVFAGSAEISKKNGSTILDGLCTAATEAVKKHEHKGAVAAFDRIPFSYASANFTFDTDSCVADLYGIRATLVDGGELRGAGNLWICPEGEVDPGAVNMDLSGQVFFDSVVQNYLPKKLKTPPIKLDCVHGDAKIQGSLSQPIFDIKWNAPEAKGAFSGVRGDINIMHEAITINSSAFTFDLLAKVHTMYPSHLSRRDIKYTNARPPPPEIEGLDVDLRMRGFDLLGLASSSPLGAPSAAEGIHSKITGRAKFQGRVVKLLKVPKEEGDCLDASKKTSINEVSGVTGEILLSGLKLNQFVVAPHLAGSMEIFPTDFKLNAVGRADEHLRIEFAGNSNTEGSDQKLPFSVPSSDMERKAMFFSLERGQLHMRLHYQPGYSAKLEVRNLQLDELELASLRGIVQKAETQLNFQKRRGHGSLSVRRPRFSGVQGESLDLSCRWSGDVITIERSVLEQASSRYELQGEYVLPGPRDHAFMEREKGEGTWKTAMAGQLGSFITSLGRWRLQLEVPGAEVADMLPVARLLSRSSDPAVVSRSKELFMQGMQHVGFCMENLKQQLENIRGSEVLPALEEGSQESVPLPGLAELKGHWHGNFEASGGGNGDTSADFDFHGDEWEWGTYRVQRVTAVGSYNNNDGLQLDKIFIQKDTATLHADGTLLGPKSTLHFAVLNFPIGLVPPLMHAIQSSTLQPVSYSTTRAPITSLRGILYMEGDLRGPLAKPQCDVQVRLLDGAIGGVDLGRAEVVASITSSNRFNFNAKLEPAVRSGHVYVRGSLPLEAKGLDAIEDDDGQKDFIKVKRPRGWNRNKSKLSEDNELGEKKLVRERLGDEGWEVQLAESLKELDWDFSDKGAVQVDATVKDGGMMLITALSPHLHWLQGNADLTLQVRGTVDQPTVDGVAAFHRVSISSPVLPRPLSNFGGTIRVLNNQLCVEGLEGRVGRKGRMHVRGKLPLRASESSIGDNIEWKADSLEVRAKNVFSGQVDSKVQLTGSLLEPVVSGMIKLSHGEAYLPQEKGVNTAASSLASSLSGMAAGGRIKGFTRNEVTVLPDRLRETQSGLEDKIEEKREQLKSLVAVELKTLKLYLGPELRVVYPLILNFAVSGELELNGLADPQWIKPKGTLTFENGDVNLVATQVRLNRDHPNRAKFEPEQGLDPTLDLALVGADWQLKIQGRARNWQDNLVISSTRSGEPDVLTRTEAARVFESQLADSLLEGNGQLAFKKLAAATVETLMPKIEGKGEFGQARWRLVSAPQIPNLLSLDPTTDPFRSLANLSFGTEVEVQLGKRLQASVVRQLKESEMATQWTLLYQLNNKLRILFSSIPSVDNRLLFEYSATSQN